VKRAAAPLLGPILRLVLPFAARATSGALLSAVLLACTDRVEAGEPYRPRELSAGVWSATHPEMQLDTRFTAGRVSLLAARTKLAPATPVELAAVAWGCEGALQAIPPVTPAPSAQHPGAIEYRHPDFDEWYLRVRRGSNRVLRFARYRRAPSAVKRC